MDELDFRIEILAIHPLCKVKIILYPVVLFAGLDQSAAGRCHTPHFIWDITSMNP